MCAANVTLKNKKKQGGGRGEHGEYGHEYNNYSIYTHIYTREYIYIHVYTYINTRTDRYICLSHVNFSHIPPCCPATQWPYPKASPVTCWRQYFLQKNSGKIHTMRLPSGISLDKSAGMSNDTCFFPPRIWRSQFFFVRRIRTSHCFTWINESWNLPRQIWWTTEWKWRVFHVGMRYLNGSWYTYEWVMTHIRTSQGTRMHRHVTHSHESWLTGTYTLVWLYLHYE